MSTLKITEAKPTPEFNIFYFAELNGSSRIEHSLMESLEKHWAEWKPFLKAYKLEQPEGGKGTDFLLLFLDKEVEDAVEEIWQATPTEGLAHHNLAITLIMSAAQSLLPELEEGKCAPLPKPGEAALEAFKTLNLTWNEEGTVNRQYAVFTPFPYSGGCEVCYLEENCPKSQLRK
ncbi:hypothetical protein [Maridesulfovibrio hydrothermalis]|uniref:Uncharacterized protein n=1 Tax=Maridesulfovibrio hydrothermalis AM13 = DSM 14728 TaxID=1121451 RepID=L0RHU8_9BACT|nr:hypothetical protein [Maridesulfovibrio hydrothermalis]CCO25166.1 conserved protein of unknown function [Maridesulfovibrio hydrothermalis AM13 = DSM 14728]